jgi:sugar O-acyltransferase (sialic acid O-acetyltransferase NeuD family)
MEVNAERRVFVVGAGGHSKVVIEALFLRGFSVVAVTDQPDRIGANVLGVPIVGDEAWLRLQQEEDVQAAIVAIGDNQLRMLLSARLTRAGIKRITVVAPFSHVSKHAKIGFGTVILAGVVIHPDTVIGEDVIINTAASVDHDCVIENGVHVGPGARLTGSVYVQEGAFIGAGAVLLPGLRIGKGATVGAGAVVLDHVGNGVTVAGVPAVPVRRN